MCRVPLLQVGKLQGEGEREVEGAVVVISRVGDNRCRVAGSRVSAPRAALPSCEPPAVSCPLTHQSSPTTAPPLACLGLHPRMTANDHSQSPGQKTSTAAPTREGRLPGLRCAACCRAWAAATAAGSSGSGQTEGYSPGGRQGNACLFVCSDFK